MQKLTGRERFKGGYNNITSKIAVVIATNHEKIQKEGSAGQGKQM